MLDYQRIVDDVRSALFNNGQDGDDFLQGAAADYALAIDEVNERLRQCKAFLRKGLRSEALQLGELEPNLLDLVVTLDLPERESWDELLKMHGLVTPAPLMLDVAAEMNEAYAIEQPLTALLDRHRLLAMSRGSMRKRVETLRRLAEADADNPNWDKDLRLYEEERLKEMQREVQQAIAAKDLAGLNALLVEVADKQWRERPPNSLVQQIAAAQADFTRQHGLAEMRQVADRLHEAHAALDVDRGRQIREQWMQLCAIWRPAADDELSCRVVPAIEWLREQDQLAAQESRHAAAIAALEDAMARRKPVEKLHLLHQEIERDGDVPSALEKQYREYHAAADRSARNRGRWIMAGIVLCILAIGAGIGAAVLNKRHLDQVETAARTFRQLFETGRHDEARNFFDQLRAESPGVAENPTIQEINARLQKSLQDEDNRRRAFLASVDVVRSSIELQAADRDALAKARTVASTEEEKATVQKLETEIVKLGETVQNKHDAEFVAQLKELKGRVAPIEKEFGRQPDVLVKKVGELARELKILTDNSPQASAAARRQAETLRGQLKTLADDATTTDGRLRQEHQITAACTDLAKFRQQLSDYAQRFPDAPRAKSFERVVREAPLWDWLAQWNETVRTIGRQRGGTIGRKEAVKAVESLKKLLVGGGGHPDTDAFRQRSAYLSAVARRLDDSGSPIEAALKPLLADPLIAGVWMLEDTAGRRYYLLEDPASKWGSLKDLDPGRMYGFEYAVGFDLTKKRKALRGQDIVPGPGVSPQRAIAENMTPILDALNDENWEASFCKMVQLIHGDARTDPLLKLVLLRRVLTVGCQGSLCLEKAFRPHMETLKNSKIPAVVNWVDPNDSAGEQQRTNAKVELRSFSDITEARNAAAKEWRSLFTPIGTEFRPMGWLCQGSDEKWLCVSQAEPQDSGRLYVVRAAETKTTNPGVVMKTIGRLEQGVAIVDATTGPSLLEGRPVFLAVPPGN